MHDVLVEQHRPARPGRHKDACRRRGEAGTQSRPGCRCRRGRRAARLHACIGVAASPPGAAGPRLRPNRFIGPTHPTTPALVHARRHIHTHPSLRTCVGLAVQEERVGAPLASPLIVQIKQQGDEQRPARLAVEVVAVGGCTGGWGGGEKQWSGGGEPHGCLVRGQQRSVRQLPGTGASTPGTKCAGRQERRAQSCCCCCCSA